MNQLASPLQLRATLFRWALFLVPGFLLLGFLSGAMSGSGAGNPWFAELVKPAIYPPPAAFGLVWSVLYVMMGLALAMVISARGAWGRGRAVIAFLVQLALNLAWSPVFFAMHQITAALVLLVAIDAALLVTIWLFWRVRPVAAMLLLPYLAWVLFATWLNWEFRVANPWADGREVSGAASRIEL
jgi:translocator protein